MTHLFALELWGGAPAGNWHDYACRGQSYQNSGGTAQAVTERVSQVPSQSKFRDFCQLSQRESLWRAAFFPGERLPERRYFAENFWGTPKNPPKNREIPPLSLSSSGCASCCGRNATSGGIFIEKRLFPPQISPKPGDGGGQKLQNGYFMHKSEYYAKENVLRTANKSRKNDFQSKTATAVCGNCTKEEKSKSNKCPSYQLFF